ncbi:MAG: DHBP synthase RibB-like alpha/beta domain-containing protein [Benniella sp.]|nr:MAG: DHBP synthase RibB-like alpha/beta domain-containing protein [Benniella sp.]
MFSRFTTRLSLTTHSLPRFYSSVAMESAADSLAQAAARAVPAATTTTPASAVATTSSTAAAATTAAVFNTLLETIDPTTITYSSSDLEDPIPEFSQPHTRTVLETAAQILRTGQVVGMPTETVYGLAANALDSVAAQRIFKAKNRPQDNPLIVHVASLKMLRSILKDQEIPTVYSDLIRTSWPGPLTLLFPRSSLIPDEITCGQPTVAVRFPSHPITRALIWACNLPLAAPSANSSGKPSPTLASHVMDDLSGKIPMVINGGQCSFGIESTVVDGLRVPPAILRPGGVTYEQIRQVRGMEQIQVYKKHFTDAAMEQAPTTPGMKYRHYSPEAEVVLVEYIKPGMMTVYTNGSGSSGSVESSSSSSSSLSPASSSTLASLSASSLSPSPSPNAATTEQYSLILKEIEKLKQEGKKRFGILRTSFTLSTTNTTTACNESDSSSGSGSGSRGGSGDASQINGSLSSDSCVIEFPLGQGSKPEDVARELFRGLRYLDGQNVDCIFVEGISEEDEGLAVMNRVRKAASRTISPDTTTFL